MKKNYPKDAEQLLSAILIKELQKSELDKVLNCKDRKSTRLNSSHGYISYAVFCLKQTTELQ